MNKSFFATTLSAAIAFGGLLTSLCAQDSASNDQYQKISLAEYRDKMKGGWIGQMAGVCWGAPTEFRYNGRIIPENETPAWKPEMIDGSFGQDDIYVEMTFLRTLELYGLDVSIRQAGIDFANSEYPLWHANVCGRRNLRMGIAPPNSSRPEFSECADDIDYQIEADYSGLISPGMPNNAVRLGEIFGRLMNYGDGLYAGQFVGAMYAEAFFETDVVKVIEKALKAIPAESQYAEMVRDVLQWKKEFPNDWLACWEKIDEKYQRNPAYRQWSCSGPDSDFNIDAKINGAYILVGLLYGNGNMDETIVISMRCGQDSDCNPSNAAGVLGVILGAKGISPKFSEKLSNEKVFDHTAYTVPALMEVSEKLAIQSVEKEGGFIREENGEKYLYIPKKETKPSALTSCANPTDKPEANGNFTEEERAQLKFPTYAVTEALERFFANFQASHLGDAMTTGLIEQYRGRKNVFQAHPESRDVPAVLAREVTPEENSVLRLEVSNYKVDKAIGDWELIVKIDGEIVYKELIGENTVGEDGWKTIEIELGKYAGKETSIEILNKANDWAWEAGIFSKIELTTK